MPAPGGKLSPEHLEAIRKSRKGVKASPETRAKQRQSHLGKKTGPDNSFYGRTHTPEALEKNRLAHLGKGRGNTFRQGITHTPEARASIGAAMKALWEKRRTDPTIDPNIPMHPERLEGFTGQVTRGRWTAKQQRDWKEACCAYCQTTDNLELDHIIPKFMGGTNARENCQTLCQPCNNWKLNHIDKPQYKALLATQGATR